MSQASSSSERAHTSSDQEETSLADLAAYATGGSAAPSDPQPSSSLTPGERLDQLIRYADAQTARIDQLEDEIARAKSTLRRVQQEDLPNLLHELGMNEVTRGDIEVKITSGVDISIPDEKKPDAYAWMVENGQGDIIKTEVTSRFGAGDIDQVDKAQKALKAAGFDADVKMSVHPSTLKSWARQSVEAGRVPPEALFNVRVYDNAKITRVKSKRR